MNKILLATIALALVATQAEAQWNMASLQNGHNAPQAAISQPVHLGDGYRTVSINLFNPYASVGSNFATTQDITDFISADEFTNEMIGNNIGKLKEENNINASLDLNILNVGINLIKRGGKPMLSIGFGVNERVEMNTAFNRTLFQLAYQGNKQFAGKTISITPRINALAFTDYWIGGALNLTLPNSNIAIKPAIRLRYLSGQASVQMSKSNSITMYTEPNGRYLDFVMDYTINSSTIGDTVALSGKSLSIDQNSFQAGAGSGFGMDLGVRLTPKQGLDIDISMMDIGGLTFSQNANNMTNHRTYRYEGQELTFADNQGINLDSLTSIIEPTYTSNAYKVKLPTKLALTGTLGLRKVERKGFSYYRHQVTLTYLQGFDNYLSATKTPWAAVGYTYSLYNVLNLGANVGVGGLWGVSVGALASLRAGPVRIGFSSSNLLPLLASKSGRGTDGAVMLGLAF